MIEDGEFGNSCPRCKESDEGKLYSTAFVWGCESCGYTEHLYGSPCVGLLGEEQKHLANKLSEIKYERTGR